MTAARGRTTGDQILRTAARGAALIGIAVVIGIVLLQVVDNGGGGGGGGGASPVTTPSTDTGATTTTKAGDVKPPAETSVVVLNGSGIAGAAATKGNSLRSLGYQMLPPGNAPQQPGTTVACKGNLDKEADALVTAVGAGTTKVAFPTTVPTGAENADCIVIVGT